MNQKVVKHLIFRLHEKLVGRKTYAYLAELRRLQWASPKELEALKLEKLKALLLHAQDKIPFYTDRFKKARFDPAKLERLTDLDRLPLLTKQEIRENLDRMTWKECPGGLHRFNTGGSSGEPLIFYLDRRRQAYDKAARALTHGWWDVQIGHRELYLWGSPVEMSRQDRFKEFRDRLTNHLLLSAFEVSEARIPEFAAAIRSFRPRSVFGYPSTISLFCTLAERRGLRFDDLGIAAVFCTAEVLYEHQREAIRRGFGKVPVVDSYGSREGGYVNCQCPEGTYHVMDPNFVIEYIKDGEKAAPGEAGEIVLTHLDAWGMPFIRYNTQDVAGPAEGPCRCGRGFASMSPVQGRTTDFVLTPDGRWLHGLSLIYVIRDIEGVEAFKVIQEDVDEITVKLKVHPALFPGDGEAKIVHGLQKRLGDAVKVRLERVDRIPAERSGKFRYIVSKVAGSGPAGER